MAPTVVKKDKYFPVYSIPYSFLVTHVLNLTTANQVSYFDDSAGTCFRMTY